MRGKTQCIGVSASQSKSSGTQTVVEGRISAGEDPPQQVAGTVLAIKAHETIEPEFQSSHGILGIHLFAPFRVEDVQPN
jgi:hypothetical protein